MRLSWVRWRHEVVPHSESRGRPRINERVENPEYRFAHGAIALDAEWLIEPVFSRDIAV
jgi:hypothetical protein